MIRFTFILAFLFIGKLVIAGDAPKNKESNHQNSSKEIVINQSLINKFNSYQYSVEELSVSSLINTYTFNELCNAKENISLANELVLSINQIKTTPENTATNRINLPSQTLEQ